MKKILKNKKKILGIILPVFFLVIIFLLIPETSHASVQAGVAKVLGWIMMPFISLFGKLAIVFLNLLVKVATYNDFINSPAVTSGWVVVRDLCNMFFVLILLIIAFASILRIESYNLKTWLPKLVIMAVLINFSKLICGIFIDFTQVIMLTFINAVKDIAGSNLTEMLGITDILSFGKTTPGEDTFGAIIGGVILALIFVVIACVVILTMLVMLVMRIVMIWIYVVLSPLAYLLASFPQGQQYSQKWWSDFSKNLIIGPVLAFFIWLSFASMGSGNSADTIKDMTPAKTDETVDATVTKAGLPENIIKYIISIGMLLGGMMIAQEMGGQAGKVVGKGMGKLQAMGAGSLKMGKRVASSAGRRGAELGLKGTGALVGGKETQVGKFLKGWGQDMGESRQKRAVKTRQNIMENMGMGKRAGRAGRELTDTIKTSLNVGDKKGKENIKEGGKQIVEGEINLKLAKNLEDTQNSYDQLDQKVLSLASQGLIGTPEYTEAFNSRGEAEQSLKEFRRNAGINENSSEQDTMNKAAQLKIDGQAKIDDGNNLVETGNKKLGGFGKFGSFLIGFTNKAFKKMSEDYEKADNFTEALSGGAPHISEIENTKFSKLDSSIDTEQKAVWDNLNSNKHQGASANLNKVVSSTLFAAGGGVKSISDANKAKMNAIGRGLKTYESSGAKLSPELIALKKLLNDFARQSGGEIKSVDEHKPGSYRLTGDNKESQGMDINESGIGSINQFGRERGEVEGGGYSSDTISYNFDKLESKGIDMETMAEGAYLEGDMKEQVKVEIISDIDEELGSFKARVSGGEQLDPKDFRRMSILENSKERLEKGDNFSLVNANKKMGLSEAVVTQRHEGAHKELDEARKKENFVPTENQKKQEEDLVEFYGREARSAGVTSKTADKVVADIIFDGQQKGLYTDEIKVNISKVTDEYKSARQKETVNNIIQKEEMSQEVNVSSAPDNPSAESVESVKNTGVDLSGIEAGMESFSDKIDKNIETGKGVGKKVDKVGQQIKDQDMIKSVQDRLSLLRHKKIYEKITKEK